jgi:hypothetical protein
LGPVRVASQDRVSVVWLATESTKAGSSPGRKAFFGLPSWSSTRRVKVNWRSVTESVLAPGGIQAATVSVGPGLGSGSGSPPHMPASNGRVASRPQASSLANGWFGFRDSVWFFGRGRGRPPGRAGGPGSAHYLEIFGSPAWVMHRGAGPRLAFWAMNRKCPMPRPLQPPKGCTGRQKKCPGGSFPQGTGPLALGRAYLA